MPAYANATGDGLARQAVAYAGRLLGVPYVWGGTSPSGVDCSGLVLLAYRYAGIKLPRTAAEQAKVGISVSTSALQPGDLVFYDNSAARPGIDHVALYVGNGQVEEAPHPGANVHIRALDASRVVAARRIVGGGGAISATPSSSATPATPAPNTLPIGWHIPGTPWDLATPGDVVSGVEGAAAAVGRSLTRLAILTPIVAGGAGLIVLGAVRAAGTGRGA